MFVWMNERLFWGQRSSQTLPSLLCTWWGNRTWPDRWKQLSLDWTPPFISAPCKPVASGVRKGIWRGLVLSHLERMQQTHVPSHNLSPPLKPCRHGESLMEACWPAGFSISHRGRRLCVSTGRPSDASLLTFPSFISVFSSSLTDFSRWHIRSQRAARKKSTAV